MAQTSDDDLGARSNIVPFSSRFSAPSDEVLEDVFRRKRSVLIQYLKFRIGDAGDASDIAQAAFLRLWEKRKQLHNENLDSLLFVTARNIANDILRNLSRRNSLIVDSYHDSFNIKNDDAVDCPERITEARQQIIIIRKIITELPYKCQYAFMRYKFDGHEYNDIARDMGISSSMVRKHVLRAITYCANRFSELEEWV